jgi:signal transduction histidine kinase
MIRDVSAERARTAEELERGATKSVCDLAAGVAHEIGNPLNAISLNLQMLERDPTDKEAIEICQSQVRRLDGIIRGFLGALRPVKPNLAPGSIVEPLKNCLAALKGQFEERRVAVTLDIRSAIPPVALDKDKMEQVFFNLLKNALEAMKDGGSINIDIATDDGDVSVAFRDSGYGMNAEQLAHLFEPYRTTKEHGTGLGLMISARIVREHGGTISAESKVGEGTTFTVKLPRLERRVRALK